MVWTVVRSPDREGRTQGQRHRAPGDRDGTLGRPLASFVAEPVPAVVSRRRDGEQAHETNVLLDEELRSFSSDVRVSVRIRDEEAVGPGWVAMIRVADVREVNTHLSRLVDEESIIARDDVPVPGHSDPGGGEPASTGVPVRHRRSGRLR